MRNFNESYEVDPQSSTKSPVYSQGCPSMLDRLCPPNCPAAIVFAGVGRLEGSHNIGGSSLKMPGALVYQARQYLVSWSFALHFPIDRDRADLSSERVHLSVSDQI